VAQIVTVSVTVGDISGQAQVGPTGLPIVDDIEFDGVVGALDSVGEVSIAVEFCHFGLYGTYDSAP
jgi:hypothetical protein